MKYALDTNIFIDGFRSDEAQAEVFAFLNRALPFTFLSAVVRQELAAGARTTKAARDVQLIAVSCREQGITLITRDGDFKRLSPLVKGFHHAAPWPAMPRPG